MNRRGFLRAALATGITAVAANAGLSKAADGGIEFLLGEMTKGARREAPVLMKNIGISWNSAAMDSVSLSWTETEVGRAERFAQQARNICDAIKPAIDALAELEEFEASKIGRVWYVGPGGDDANDGLTPESCLLSFEEGMKRAGREDELPMSVWDMTIEGWNV
ncbi:hypothetical protein LCGC14_0500400 [marine sediment metagenome]|uniref:Uncharacterized protein n=1 Tax=marine sediment metagenome TaxID=412755 RepID=A0A0F9SMJ4_9ZZZZ